MQRRTFLTSFLATAGIVKLFGFGQLTETFACSAIRLNHGDVVIAESGTNLSLPLKPKEGDWVQIIVENSTLHRPCIIQNELASIAGDHEPLVLDSIANFKLVYKANLNEWVLA